MRYDAFISYSHEADRRLAAELERALQGLARPWNKRRAMDVFRDGGNLNLSAHLWGSIQEALDGSRFFLYLASPAAATSKWVEREIEYWKAHRDVDHLIILLTDGTLTWDAEQADFDMKQSTVIPHAMQGIFPGEPLYLDMRWTRAEPELSIENGRFKRQIVQLAAAIRGVAVEDIAGEEVEQHRRMTRIRNAAIAGLAALTIAAIGFAGFALSQREAARVQQARAEQAAAEATASAREAERRRVQAEAAEDRATTSATVAKEKADEATAQRIVAENEAHNARVALGQADFQEAMRLLAASDPGRALAHLARALRNDPDSMAARGWVAHLVFNEASWWPEPLPEVDVFGAAFSPDGRRLITSGRFVRVWDFVTRQHVGIPIEKAFSDREVSFTADGGHLLVRTDEDVQVFDARTGEPVSPSIRHEATIYSAAFSPDGHFVVTASDDKTARIWDAQTGQAVRGPLQHQDAISRAVFSKDGHHLLTIPGPFQRDSRVLVWNAATGRQIGAPIGKDIIASFNPDERYVATGTPDGNVRVWDRVAQEPVSPRIPLSGKLVGGTASRDGRLFAAKSDDNTVRIFEVATGRPIGVPLRHQELVDLPVFSHDASRIVTVTGGMAYVWDAETGEPIGAPLRHQARVIKAVFGPDGRRVVTTSSDGIPRVWDAPTNQPMRPSPDSQRSGRPAAITPDGHRIVANSERTIRVWDTTTGRTVGSPVSYSDMAQAIAVSPNGGRIVAVYVDDFEDGSRIWDTATGQPVSQPFQNWLGGTSAPQHGINMAAFSPDGRLVVTAGRDQTARIWDAATGRPVGAALRHKGPVTTANFSSDGRYIVTASRDKTVRIWDVATTREVGTPLLHQAEVRDAVFSSGDRYVITSSDDGTGHIWDAVTHEETGVPVRGVWRALHRDGRQGVKSSGTVAQVTETGTGLRIGAPLEHPTSVTAAVFSPDGRYVLTAAGNSTAYVWNAATGQLVSAPLHHDRMLAVAFSQDGRQVITTSIDATVRVWQVLLNLPSRERVVQLADLAELFGGYRLTDFGSQMALESSERTLRIRNIAGPGATEGISLDQLRLPFLGGKKPEARGLTFYPVAR